jgi:uncharacterized protein (DUF697 family)
MPNPLKMANIWRIIRDVDLEVIRRNALRPVELWIVAETEPDGRAVRHIFTSSDSDHPSVRVVTPASTDASGPLPTAVIFVTRSLDLTPAMAATRDVLRARAVPAMTVLAGQTGPIASAPRVGEDGRVAVTALDESATTPIRATLLALFNDDRRLALARHLPAIREPLFQALTNETAQANASFALTTGLAEVVPVLTVPLALGDVVVLTKNQLLLGYRIVLAAGRDGEPRKLLGEIVGVLGGGLLFRQIAREMVGLVPIAGLPLKIAVAYSGTWAIGKAMALWATEGRTITADALRTMTAEGLERGRTLANRMLTSRSASPAGSRWERLRGYLPRRGKAAS